MSWHLRAWVLGGMLAGWGVPSTSAQSWQRLTTPLFTVVSSASPKDTRQVAEEFEQFVLTLNQVVPADLKRWPPLTIVVFGNERDYRRFWPEGSRGQRKEVAGFFARTSGSTVFGTTGGKKLTRSERHQIFFSAGVWYLKLFDDENPIWLEAGLAELFADFTVQRGRRLWGHVSDDRLPALRKVEKPSLDQLVKVGWNELDLKDDSGRADFYIQSWLLMHYHLLGDRPEARGMPSECLRLYRAGLSAEAAFQQAFGASYEDVAQPLQPYLQRKRLPGASEPLLPGGLVGELTPASDREVAAALARLALGGYNLDLAEEYIDRLRGEASPGAELHELQGVLAELRSDADGAVAAYGQAARLGSKHFWVHWDLARRQHERNDGKSRGLTDPALARRLAGHYEDAITLQPYFLPAYRWLALALLSVESVEERDRRVLESGSELFPWDDYLQTGLAVVDYKSGRKEAALQRLAAVSAKQTMPRSAEEEAGRKLAAFWKESWRRDEALQALQSLLAGNQFAQAHQFLDRLSAEEPSEVEQVALAQLRRRLDIQERMAQASAARDEGRSEEAQSQLQQLLPLLENEPGTRQEVERRLDTLKREEPSR